MNSSDGPADNPDRDPMSQSGEQSAWQQPRGGGNTQNPLPGGLGKPPPAIEGPLGGSTPGGSGLLAAETLSSLLWAGASFVILFWLSGALDLEERTWVLIGLWLVSGLAVLWQGFDGVVARFLLGLRHPTMVEQQRLAPSWLAVARKAGVDPNRYTLWIYESDGPTGVAVGGHTVSVTGWALYTLPPSHLEAVLAQDLVTHLRGRTWLSRLALWYSMPTRLLALVVRLMLRLSRTIPAVGCTIIGFLMVSYFGFILASLVFYDSLLVPLLFLSPLFAPLLFIGAAKLVERMADRAAVDLGYGRKLLEVFYGWQAQHQESNRRPGFAQPEWLSGQPSVAERIRAIEVYAQPR